MSESEFASWLEYAGNRVENQLTFWMRQLRAPDHLRAAMEHAALGGGKRLRPAMTLAVHDSAVALDAACALECVHCYSLAHDDLPCMDNADTRRGKPSCHAAFGEAMALLAGDCLHSLAFEILARHPLPSAAFAVLAHAAGAEGMGGGQALDLQADAENESQLRKMHEMKTGALFNCALQLGLLCQEVHADSTRRDVRVDKSEVRMDFNDGGIIKKADHVPTGTETPETGSNNLKDQSASDDNFNIESQSVRLQEFARAFGLLFQIANDIAGARDDRALGKSTYYTVLGESGARQQAQNARDAALSALDGAHPMLAGMTEFVWRQTK